MCAAKLLKLVKKKRETKKKNLKKNLTICDGMYDLGISHGATTNKFKNILINYATKQYKHELRKCNTISNRVNSIKQLLIHLSCDFCTNYFYKILSLSFTCLASNNLK